MNQGIVTPLTRQLMRWRHQAVVAPTMLDEGTLSPANVAAVLAEEDFKGRKRLFPPLSRCGPCCCKSSRLTARAAML